MPDVVKRGYMPSDDKEFIDQIEKLHILVQFYKESNSDRNKRLSVCKDTIVSIRR